MLHKKFLLCLIIPLALGSCTKDFEEINVNPNAPSSLPLDYLLGATELQAAGTNNSGNKSWRINLGHAAPYVQQISSTDIGFYGGSFYTSPQNNFAAYFEDSYPNFVKNVVNLLQLSREDGKNVNITSMARILRVIEFARMTDLYGDIPYFDAGKAYSEENFTPKYDTQQEIYADMLKELDEASVALDATAYIPTTSDYLYAGDVAKWKRAAYTLMLRLAMRMQKVDDAAAKTWAAKAIAGGIISNSDENIAVHFDGAAAQISTNPNSWILGPLGTNQANVSNGSLWAKTLVDMMKDRQDPRLILISVLKDGDATLDNQIGLPNAVNTNILATLTPSNIDEYSRPAPSMYQGALPWIYMTYAEAKMLEAEAIERSYVTGDAEASFIEGQTEALKQVSVYGASPADADIATYQSANTYPAAGTLQEKLNAIHTELYLLHAVTLNFVEAWSNWRRTGYPELTPVNPVGNETSGQIPRRLKYSPTEYGVNPNIEEAVNRQGEDSYMTRIWWDK